MDDAKAVEAKLKNCPFCGGEVEVVLPPCSDMSEYIRHSNGSQCPVEFSAFTLCGGDKMVRLWNTRKDSDHVE